MKRRRLAAAALVAALVGGIASFGTFVRSEAAGDDATYVEVSNNGTTQTVKLTIHADPFIHLNFRIGQAGAPFKDDPTRTVSNVRSSVSTCNAVNLPQAGGGPACVFTAAQTNVEITFDITPPQPSTATSKLVLDTPNTGNCPGSAPACGARALNIVGPTKAVAAPASQPTCKFIIYVDTPTYPLAIGHTFVQVKPQKGLSGPAVAVGEIPASTNFFGGPAQLEKSGSHSWTSRLVYDISQQQCDQAKDFIKHWPDTQPLYDLTEDVTDAAATSTNCTGFVVGMANLLHLKVPTYTAFDGVPDPRTLSFNMNLPGADAALGPGVRLERNTNNLTPDDQPDPPGPIPNVGSPSDLAMAGLKDPDALAVTLGFKHDVSSLPNVSIASGGTVEVQRSAAAGPAALYAIDWGDGSAPDQVIKRFTSGTDNTGVGFSHGYARAGSFTARLVVFTGGAIEEYSSTVSVAPGSPTKAALQFTVPAPPAPKPFGFQSTGAAMGVLPMVVGVVIGLLLCGIGWLAWRRMRRTPAAQ